MYSGKKAQHDFPKMRGGGQRPFGTFPKIHPFWLGHPSLRTFREGYQWEKNTLYQRFSFQIKSFFRSYFRISPHALLLLNSHPNIFDSSATDIFSTFTIVLLSLLGSHHTALYLIRKPILQIWYFVKLPAIKSNCIIWQIQLNVPAATVVIEIQALFAVVDHVKIVQYMDFSILDSGFLDFWILDFCGLSIWRRCTRRIMSSSPI